MQKKVSLVLSGGGARGLAHIGVIEELEKQGYEIVSIAGTSMGALVGGFYTLGKMSELKDFICSLTKTKILEYVDFTLSTQGLIKGEKIFKKMREFAQDAQIEDLKIKYTATAVDILNNKEIIFTKGSIYEAIRASISIPTVFTPVKTKDGFLVDGGLKNNIPVSNVLRTKNDLLIVVDVNAQIPFNLQTGKKEQKTEQENYYKQILKKFNKFSKADERINYFDLANRSINMLINGMSALALEKHFPDLLIQFPQEMCSLFDFHKAKELVEIGHFITARNLKKLSKQIKNSENKN